MLLEALVACAGVTLNAVATAIDVTIDEGRVYAEGDLDFRGTLGVDKEAPVGFETSACGSSSRPTPTTSNSRRC